MTFKTKKTSMQISTWIDAHHRQNLYGYAIGEETSKTGYHHFHIYILWMRKTKLTMRELDAIGGIHGHYKPIRVTPMKALAYCTKDGKNIFGGPCGQALKAQAKAARAREAEKLFLTAMYGNLS